jgi:hypothetical protein
MLSWLVLHPSSLKALFLHPATARKNQPTSLAYVSYLGFQITSTSLITPQRTSQSHSNDDVMLSQRQEILHALPTGAAIEINYS